MTHHRVTPICTEDGMGLIIDYLAAMGAKDGFRIGWKRVRHIRHGHPYDNSELLEKLRSEKHPHTDGEYIYTVNVRKCLDCGLTYNDAGLEPRVPNAGVQP